MEFLTKSEYSFPSALRDRECTYGDTCKSVFQKKCQDDPEMKRERNHEIEQRNEMRKEEKLSFEMGYDTIDLMKKDAGTSNISSTTGSRTTSTGKELKLGLNFSMSQSLVGEMDGTDMSLYKNTSKLSSQQTAADVEVVDLTDEFLSGEEEKVMIEDHLANMNTEEDDIDMILEDSRLGGRGDRLGSLEQSKKIKDEKSEKRRRKKSLLVQNTQENVINDIKHELFSEEISDSDDFQNCFIGKKRWKSPAQMAELHGGKMMKIKRTKDGVKISFTCKMNHRFSLMNHEEEGWCKVCEALMRNARNHAEKNNGKLLSQKLEAELDFECEKGHRWRISYKKCLRNWCKVCKKERKKIVKEILAEEKRRVEEERKTKQDKMLEEARLKMIKENSKKREDFTAELKTFKILEDEISRIASKYAREFCDRKPESDFEQMLELYKILILPEKSLRSYFKALTKVDLKKKFRRYTILLHPDKNCHPKAKSAFQKIYGIFEEVVRFRKRSEDFLKKPQ